MAVTNEEASVDDVTDQSTWQEFTRPGFRLRFRYPTVTPQGRLVHRVDDQRGDSIRVHLTARDSQELYVEVARFPTLSPHQEYARHRAYLEQRGGLEAIADLTEARLGQWPAWAYAFRWEQRERSTLLLPVGQDTYRIIHDPRSPLNALVLATVAILE